MSVIIHETRVYGSHRTASKAMVACFFIKASSLSWRVRMEGRHAFSSLSSARMSMREEGMGKRGIHEEGRGGGRGT